MPSSGSAWVWFGGSFAAQSSSLTQNAVIDMTSEFLQFDFWTGSTTSNASLTLSIDGTGMWTVTQANAATFTAGYSTVSIALDAFADGDTHAIRWAYSDTATAQGALTDNWSLDNVRLTPVQAIPEPGTLALTGAGLLGLALRASRRRSS